MKILFISIFITLCQLSFAQQNIDLQTGDLLFQVGKGSDFENAIVSSTEGEKKLSYSHVGVVFVDKEIFVLEAEPKNGVAKTPLQEFLDNGAVITVVGRLKEEYKYTIPEAIERILPELGKLYNFTFLFLGEGFYCSELIQKNFILDNGECLFPPAPLSFGDSNTEEIHNYWIEYYKKYNMEVPKGELGSNPNEMSASEFIEIIGRIP